MTSQKNIYTEGHAPSLIFKSSFAFQTSRNDNPYATSMKTKDVFSDWELLLNTSTRIKPLLCNF